MPFSLKLFSLIICPTFAIPAYAATGSEETEIREKMVVTGVKMETVELGNRSQSTASTATCTGWC